MGGCEEKRGIENDRDHHRVVKRKGEGKRRHGLTICTLIVTITAGRCTTKKEGEDGGER